MKELIEIGKIVSTRGLDGTVKVLSGFLPDDFQNLTTCLVDKTEHKVKKCGGKAGCLFFNFDDINNVETAEMLKNKSVFVKRENIKLAKGEYLIDDLIGMDVFTNEEVFVGKVCEIENFGSKDVYTLKNGTDEKTFCLVDNLIQKVDYENNKLILNSKILNEVIV
ncbi:MAG: ribosome maturation factor RimM [Christensenellales bacterium]